MARLFTSQTPANPNFSDGTPGIAGATTIQFAVDGQINGVWFFATTTVSGTYTALLWTPTNSDTGFGGAGTQIASKVRAATPTAGAWNYTAFDTPVPVTAGSIRRVGNHNSAGRYVSSSNFFTTALTNGDLTAPAHNAVVAGLTIWQGTFYIAASTTGYPNQNFNSACYFVDVDFTPTGGATPVSVGETGSGSDGLSASATAALTDTGTGADALAVPTRSIVVIDLGAGADTLTVPARAAPVGESAAGADAVQVGAAVSVADTATATDSLTATATTALTDTASAADAVGNGLGTARPLADAGSAADVLTVAVTAALTDTGAAADARTSAASVPLTDAGTGADTVDNGMGTAKTTGDAGAAADLLTVVATLVMGDSAAGVDSPAGLGAGVLLDAGLSGEVASAAATVGLAETAAAAQAVVVSASVAVADAAVAVDAGAGQDDAFLTRMLNDTATATEVFGFVPSLITGRPAVRGTGPGVSVRSGATTASVRGVY